MMGAETSKVEFLLDEANAARKENRLKEAQKKIISAVQISVDLSNEKLLACSLNDLARINRDLGNNQSSIAAYEVLANLLDKNADEQGWANAMRHLADIYKDEGNIDIAEEYYKRVISIYRKNSQSSRPAHANAIRGFALLQSKQGKATEAILLWKEARAFYEDSKIREGVDECDEWIKKLSRG